MPKKLFYRNARDAIPALSTSRTDIDDDAAGAAVGVAEEIPVVWDNSINSASQTNQGAYDLLLQPVR